MGPYLSDSDRKDCKDESLDITEVSSHPLLTNQLSTGLKSALPSEGLRCEF